MNECIEGTSVEAVQPLVVREETVELARKVLATMPAVREELVNELHAEVKSGAYDPSPETIADAFLRHRLNERPNDG